MNEHRRVFSYDGTPMIFSIAYADVCSCDVSAILSALNQFFDLRENIVNAKGQFALVFEGWDEDPRDIYDIPEIRRYMAILDDEFPYWFYFHQLHTGMLKGICLCLCRIRKVPGGSNPDPADYAGFMKKHIAALNRLCERYSLEAARQERTQAVLRYFGVTNGLLATESNVVTAVSPPQRDEEHSLSDAKAVGESAKILGAKSDVFPKPPKVSPSPHANAVKRAKGNKIRMMKGIRIHPLGSRMIDHACALALNSVTPSAFRKAQVLVEVAYKYLHKKGWFSTETSRSRALRAGICELERALNQDGFTAHKPDEWSTQHVLFQYLSMFSDAFPNCQEEYKCLTRFIRQCYPTTQPEGATECSEQQDDSARSTSILKALANELFSLAHVFVGFRKSIEEQAGGLLGSNADFRAIHARAEALMAEAARIQNRVASIGEDVGTQDSIPLAGALRQYVDALCVATEIVAQKTDMMLQLLQRPGSVKWSQFKAVTDREWQALEACQSAGDKLTATFRSA